MTSCLGFLIYFFIYLQCWPFSSSGSTPNSIAEFLFVLELSSWPGCPVGRRKLSFLPAVALGNTWQTAASLLDLLDALQAAVR